MKKYSIKKDNLVQISSQSKKVFLGCIITTLILCFGSQFSFAAPGDLDPTFGNSGKVTTLNSGGGAYSVALQSDGKLVLSGEIGAYPNTDFLLVRYNADGSLDSSFGSNGKVITPIGNGSDSAFALAIQADGKIIAVGSSDNGSNNDFAVVRYNPSGSLDTSFDGDGKITIPIGTDSDQAYAVTTQADGKIIVAGGSRATPSNNFAVVRLNLNGSLDNTFDGDGKVTTPFGDGIDGASSVAVQQDGKIVVAGDGIGSSYDFALARYNTNGSLDTSFDGDGKVITSVSSNPDSASSIAIQSDGKIVAAGYADIGTNNSDFAIVRYNTDGSLDTTFNGTGKITTPIGNSNEYANSVAVQQNGRIIVAGGSYSGTTFNFALVRYNANGSLDTSFSDDGKLTTAFGNSYSNASSVVIQRDGNIIAVGNFSDANGGGIAIARYIGDATILSQRFFDFDGDGKADVSVFRPSNGTWYLLQSANGFTGLAFGLGTDKLVPADYDGDGKTDIAVYRSGTWYLQRSQLGFTGISFGTAEDIPVPADYDGDGKADVAVFRPSNGTWYLLQSQTGFTGIQFGQNGDKPTAADYDGDGKADLAVYRGGIWYLNRSQLGFTSVQFGAAEDKPVPADYDGDGKFDLAVFRPSNGTWYLLQSLAGFTGVGFGIGTDSPVPADYDGDGKADIAVFRNGTWYLQRSSQGFTGVTFGVADDKPIPNAFVP